MALNLSCRAYLAAGVSATALLVFALPASAQSSSAQEGAVSVDDIIVTAQKREQAIQEVPIAVSAFTGESLDALKIEGGAELLRAIPNVSFAKGNFSMYNFSIRGVGTKSISASSDPAVAVSFNNSPLIRNRLFESEYLDVQRVEVLRGPQGTLYGRNATAGVVNMLPNLADPDFDAMLKVEGGNFGSLRGQMMVNLPLSETFWVRGAASFTKREGFDYNTHLGTRVNGRDLHTTRISAVWEPTDRFRANLIWERFGEDDNRSRTGKQLCTTDPGLSQVGSVTNISPLFQGRMSQGCLPSSLYADAAYGTPNGTGMSHVHALTFLVGRRDSSIFSPTLPFLPAGENPYEGVVQSKNLREISTSYDPVFRAGNDVVQFNLSYDIGEKLTLHSQTLYTKDDYYSTQDYNRFIPSMVFLNTSDLYGAASPALTYSPMAPGGFYNDPQLGAHDRMISADLSVSDNRQWYQELRLQSDLDGRFNFSIGANYLDFKSNDDYYVFNNHFNLLSEYFYNVDTSYRPNDPRLRITKPCLPTSTDPCVYVDYSHLSDLEGDGHNYFRSKNEVHTRSWAVFGEGYWDLSDSLGLTVGLRYTDDTKSSGLYPSQLLLGVVPATGGPSSTGGKVYRGYPKLKDIEQSWEAVTGRLVLDWKPSEDVMVYGSYARGYKGGGCQSAARRHRSLYSSVSTSRRDV